MYDIHVAYIRDQVPVQTMTLMSTDPLVFRISGANFTGAYCVMYGKYEIRDIEIRSRTILDFTVPEDLKNERPTELSVLSTVFTSTPSSRMMIRLNNLQARTDGLHRMVQQFLLVLLTTPGSSAFDHKMGGGLTELIHRSYGPEELADLSVAFSSRVSQAVSQIRENYAGRSVPLSERLRSAEVYDVYYDASSATISGVIRLTNELGVGTQMNLGL